MEQNALIARYRISLAGLCYYCAKLGELHQKIENGEVVAETEVRNICSSVEKGKSELLDLKTQLGYNDELSFMENLKFAGFEIRDGVLVGDTEKIFTIVRPWYTQFPDKSNNFQFEVANYLLAFMKLQADRELPRKTKISFLQKVGLRFHKKIA